LKLLLLSDRGSFFGDPYYGTVIKRLIFEPNNVILRDIVIDAVYTAII
jgi:phage baseplate assembly protein W